MMHGNWPTTVRTAATPSNAPDARRPGRMRRRCDPPARYLTVAAVAACLLLGFTMASAQNASAMPALDNALASQIPASYHNRTLVVATTLFPPFELFASDNKTIVGSDSDLYQALGSLLGLKFKLVNVKFDTILPGIQGGRYDLASPLGDFASREKIVTIVDYSQGGSSVLVQSGGQFQPSTINDLCGHVIGIEKGTAETKVTTIQNQRCTANGAKPMTVHEFPDLGSAELALLSSRIEGVLADSAGNGYAAKQNQKLVSRFITGGSDIPGFGATFGIILPKDSPLAEPIRQGILKLMSTGTYQAIFNKWGIPDNGIQADRVKIDGMGSN